MESINNSFTLCQREIRTMSKADNMLSILWLLKTQKRVTARQMAEHLEIHIRSVYRYIDALCASGVPIVADSGHNGGYSLPPSFRDAPLLFDRDEQKALVHAARFALEAGYPFAGVLNQAIAKLKRYTNEEQLHAIQRHETGLDVIHPPADASQTELLKELELACGDRRTLRMEYRKGSETDATSRLLDPYGLVYWKSRWYLVGYCRLREEIRSFRVDRIQSLAGTDSVFERPADFSARDFFMNRLLPDFSSKERLIPVTVRGKPEALNDLCSHWLLGHALAGRSKEEARFLLDEPALRMYVPYLFLPYGKAVKVLEPELLRERIAGVAEELMNFYREPLH